MLDIEKHSLLLKQILKDIYKSEKIQNQLVFKGGTCLYLFYNLNRFSTDLDFNLIAEDLNIKEIYLILNKYIKVEDYRNKHNTWFWLGGYEKGLQKIKIEISKRNYPDKLVVLDFFGISVNTLAPEYMFAHKLCAITDRAKLQNRDLFDAWFMFDKQWEPNEEIINLRTGMSINEYYSKLIKLLEKMSNKNILDGLGEVLDEKLKVWVKNNLIESLLFQLKIRAK